MPFKCDLQRYNAVRKKPKDWIPDKCWLDLVALSELARVAAGLCTLESS